MGQESRVDDTYRDELTGALNRKFLREVFPRELEHSRRLGFPYAILVLDLDNFKQINDTYGHLRGDEVLRSLVRLLQNQLREGDRIVRYGGDEFVILLPQTHPEGAYQVGQKILHTLERTPIHSLQLTASIGVAASPRDGWSWEELFARADQAMYRAKSLGKKRVESLESTHLTLTLPVRHFVGRKDQIQQAHRLMEQQTPMILLVGPAGIGKTRLAMELLVRTSSPYYRGNAYALHENIPFTPIREILRRRLDEDPDHLSLLSPPLQEELNALLHGRSAQSSLPPDLLRLFDAVSQLFPEPTVFMIDDIQWADALTLDFLHYLLRQRSGIRVIGTLRVEERNREPLSHHLPHFYREGLVQEIFLPSFQAAEIQEFLQHALGTAPPPGLVEQLQRWSGGNPYFMEEILSDLYRNGHLRSNRGMWSFTPPSPYTPPNSLEALLYYKLSFFSAAHQHVLEAAAVLGPRVDVELLRAFLSDLHTPLEDVLEDLASVHILAPTDHGYAFSEEVFRELVLRRLSPHRRKRLHSRAAELLHDRADAFTLAYHHTQAGDAERAFPSCMEASRRALDSYAYPQALEYLRWAEPYIRGDAERVAWLALKARIHQHLGQTDEAVRTYEALLQLSSQTEIPLLEVLKGLSDLYVNQGRYRAALRLFERYRNLIQDPDERAVLDVWEGTVRKEQRAYQRARNLLKHALQRLTQPSDERARALNILAQIEQELENLEEAERLYLLSLDTYRTIHDLRGEAVIATNLATLYEYLDRYEDARAMYRKAIQIYEDIHYLRGKAIATYDLASLHFDLGQFDLALELVGEALDQARRLQEDPIIRMIYNLTGSIHRERGEFERALEFYRMARDISQRLEDRSWVNHIDILIAYTYFLMKRYQETRRLLDQVDASLSQERQHLTSDRVMVWMFRANLALVHRQSHEALTYSEKVTRKVRHSPRKDLQMYAALVRAQSFALAGKSGHGKRWLRRAQNIQESIPNPWLKAEYLFGEGEFWEFAGDRKKAEMLFLRAAERYERLGMSYWKEESIERARKVSVASR